MFDEIEINKIFSFSLIKVPAEIIKANYWTDSNRHLSHSNWHNASEILKNCLNSMLWNKVFFEFWIKGWLQAIFSALSLTAKCKFCEKKIWRLWLKKNIMALLVFNECTFFFKWNCVALEMSPKFYDTFVLTYIIFTTGKKTLMKL